MCWFNTHFWFIWKYINEHEVEYFIDGMSNRVSFSVGAKLSFSYIYYYDMIQIVWPSTWESKNGSNLS